MCFHCCCYWQFCIRSIENDRPHSIKPMIVNWLIFSSTQIGMDVIQCVSRFLIGEIDSVLFIFRKSIIVLLHSVMNEGIIFSSNNRKYFKITWFHFWYNSMYICMKSRDCKLLTHIPKKKLLESFSGMWMKTYSSYYFQCSRFELYFVTSWSLVLIPT